MNDGVDFTIERRRERRGVVREKIVAPTAAAGARANREVEPEMGVSQQQDPEVSGHPGVYGYRCLVGRCVCSESLPGSATDALVEGQRTEMDLNIMSEAVE